MEVQCNKTDGGEMTLFAEIDTWLADAQSKIRQQSRKQKVELYAEGVKSKLQQAEYSLAQLIHFAKQSDHTTTTTDSDEPTITDRVGFYCDAYWAFLFSSLDILAQAINQSLKLKLDEKDVSFKSIEQKLGSKKYNGSAIQQKVSACVKSNAFKNLDNYRNCSTHRRQIYTEEQTYTFVTSGTRGYPTSSTAPVLIVKRLICDNPLAVSPKLNQQREIPEYIEEVQTRIYAHIVEILKNLTPIK